MILAEESGPRRIPIVVGTAEAQSIAIALEQIKPPRPLTHDLFVAFARIMHAELREVFIYKFEDGVYYSELVFRHGADEIRLDSRTSDAIAIALRVDCEIYTTEQLLRDCGVVLEEEDEEGNEGDRDDDLYEYDPDEDYEQYLDSIEPEDLANEEELANWLELLDNNQLKKRMDDAIAKENYEYAKIYKDALHKRKEGGDD